MSYKMQERKAMFDEGLAESKDKEIMSIASVASMIRGSHIGSSSVDRWLANLRGAVNALEQSKEQRKRWEWI